MGFLFYTALSFVSYMLLTASAGDGYLWPVEEILAGAAVSLVTAAFACRLLPESVTRQLINPLKWVALTFYLIFPFFIVLIIANIEVAYRVLTGKINPAVVKLDTNFKSSVGTFFLANSITLSPGTFSLELDEKDNSLYIHCLSWNKKTGKGFSPKEVAPIMYFWLSKIFK